MTKWTRWIALATLAAFLGFASATSFHTHAQAGEPPHCSICKVAQQTPALTDRPETTPISLESSPVQCALDEQPHLQLVFTTHGLSPPTL